LHRLALAKLKYDRRTNKASAVCKSRRHTEAKRTKVKVGFKGVSTEPEARSSACEKSSISNSGVEYSYTLSNGDNRLAVRTRWQFVDDDVAVLKRK